MNVMLRPELTHVLESNKVEISEPRDQMMRLGAVRIGPGFTKPATNVLLVQRGEDGCWEVFVDEDLCYGGDDPVKRRLFEGQCCNGWRQLTFSRPFGGASSCPPDGRPQGDVNLVVLRVLEWLDSPMGGIARRAARVTWPVSTPTVPLDPQLERVGRFLSPKQLQAAAVPLTARQAEVADRVVEVVTQQLSPACPLIHGASGSGKTVVAATAACRLIDRGYADQAFQIHGAAIASGAIFWPQRDDRLRHILHVLPSLRRTLVLVEQFDFLLNNTEVTECLICDCLDRGTKLVGVMRPDVSIHEVGSAASLLRRLQPLRLDEPEPHEVRAILGERLRGHPLAGRIQVAPEVLPAVMKLAHLRPGANPGAAVGLLDALLTHVHWTGSDLATPDDVYHLVHPDQD
jgi:hypothetical protein